MREYVWLHRHASVRSCIAVQILTPYICAHSKKTVDFSRWLGAQRVINLDSTMRVENRRTNPASPLPLSRLFYLCYPTFRYLCAGLVLLEYSRSRQLPWQRIYTYGGSLKCYMASNGDVVTWPRKFNRVSSVCRWVFSQWMIFVKKPIMSNSIWLHKYKNNVKRR